MRKKRPGRQNKVHHVSEATSFARALGRVRLAAVSAVSSASVVPSFGRSPLPHLNERYNLKGFPPNNALHRSLQTSISFLFAGLGAGELRR